MVIDHGNVRNLCHVYGTNLNRAKSFESPKRLLDGGKGQSSKSHLTINIRAHKIAHREVILVTHSTHIYRSK